MFLELILKILPKLFLKSFIEQSPKTIKNPWLAIFRIKRLKHPGA